MEIMNRATGVNLDLGFIAQDGIPGSLDWRCFDMIARPCRDPAGKNPLDAGWTAVNIKATAIHG